MFVFIPIHKYNSCIYYLCRVFVFSDYKSHHRSNCFDGPPKKLYIIMYRYCVKAIDLLKKIKMSYFKCILKCRFRYKICQIHRVSTVPFQNMIEYGLAHGPRVIRYFSKFFRWILLYIIMHAMIIFIIKNTQNAVCIQFVEQINEWDVHKYYIICIYRFLINDLIAYTVVLCTLFCLYSERFTFIVMNLTLNFGKSCLYTKFASLAIQEVPYLMCTNMCLCYRQFRHY